jgi:hypothetical protein
MKEFEQPLANLKTKVLAGGDFGAIMSYFFDTCAENREFLDLGKLTRHQKLEAILPQVLMSACGEKVKLNRLLLTEIPEAKFIHGGFMVEGRPGSVIYFEDIDKGVVALMARDGITTDFVRFTCQSLGSGAIWQ